MERRTMTDEAGAAPEPARPSRHWRKPASPLSQQTTQRQGLITNLVFAHLGGRDAAIAFLNAHHDGLGAKPLDLAGASAEGYQAVEREVLRLAALRVDTRP
jgi:hypothetical protein